MNRLVFNFCKLTLQNTSRQLVSPVASNSLLLKSSSNAVKPLYNQISCAYYRQYNFARHTNWVKRRGGGWDENISKENRELIDEEIVNSYAKSESPLKDGPWKRGEWDPQNRNKRIGLIGIKLGSIPQWNKNGEKFFVTLLQILDNHVIDYVPPEVLVEKNSRLKTLSKDGKYGMILVGALSSDPRLYTPQYLKLFENSGVPPKRKLTKFMVTPNAIVRPGTPLYASHFRVGDFVDVGAYSTGHGFQGGMKRWGFKGGPHSHGATKFHRKRGTVNSGRKRKKLIPGTKMPAQMGLIWREQLGLKIWRINNKSNILFIHGPVIPGPTHCYVRITDSCLPKNQKNFTAESHPPFPTLYMDELKEPLAEEVFDAELHQFKEPTITFEGFQVKTQPKREGAKLAKIKG